MKTEKAEIESVRVVDPPHPEPRLLPGPKERVVKPSLPPPRKHSYGWLWTLIVLALLGVGGYFAYPYAMKLLAGNAATAARGRGQRPSAPVIVATARRGDMPLYLDEIATVEPLNTVTVHTRVDGQLMKVAFTEGQIVQKDQLLAEIDPRPFQVQLEQAQGTLIHDQALLDNANLDLKRYQDALKEADGAVSQQQVDTQAALVRQYEGNVATDQGAIHSAQVNLVYCEIRSPVTGRAGLRLVDEGNIVHAADTNGLVVIAQEQPITVVFSVPQDFLQPVLKKLYAGEPFAVDVLDRDVTTKLASGTVLATDSQIDQTTASLKFKAIFPNEDLALFPSQAVNARLYTETLHDVVIVPAAAVQTAPDSSSFVYVVKKDARSETQPATQPTAPEAGGANGAADDSAPKTWQGHQNGGSGGGGSGPGGGAGRGPQGTVEMREVTVGPQEGELIVITSGLDAGEVVVTDGVDKLQDGARVTIGRSDSTTQPAGTTTAPGGAAKTGHRGGAGHHRSAATQNSNGNNEDGQTQTEQSKRSGE